jgi:hypothetical protein
MGCRRLLWLGAAAAALSPIAACEASLDPIVVAMNCPDQPLRGPEAFADTPVARLIDDFEDGDYYLARYAGRDGNWMPATDMSSTMVFAGPSGACAARGTKAGNFSGAGFRVHGASWTGFFTAQPPMASPYNLTAAGPYTGISFWAAIGKGDAPFSVELGISTMDSVPNGNVCSSILPPGGTPIVPVCFDYYKTTVNLTHTWQRFVIPFSELENTWTQFPFRPDAAVGFLVWPWETEFDIWFDDIRFEQ